MNKSEIYELLNRINSCTGREHFSEYFTLLKQCIDKLRLLQQEDKNPLLDAWLNMGIDEIQKELNIRLKDGFENYSPDRQKTEFLYSRSIVTMALTNILMHL